MRARDERSAERVRVRLGGRDCSHWQGPQRAECLASQKADADAHAATPTPGARQAQQGQAKVEVRPHGAGGEAATYDVRVQEGQQPGGAP